MSEIILPNATLTEAVSAELLQPGRIRVLTWNLQKQRAPAIHDELKWFAARADLAVLQEVWLEDSLTQSFCPTWTPSFGHGVKTPRKTTGVMTLSSAVPLKTLHHQSLEPLLRTAKATSVTHYALAEREHDLLVVNIHAINFCFGTRAYLAQLQNILPAIEKHRGPVIFAGDLNTWSQDRLVVLEAFTRRLNLREVSYEMDHRKRILRRPLDYVFVRDMEIGEAITRPSRHSDHNPMLVSLSC